MPVATSTLSDSRRTRRFSHVPPAIDIPMQEAQEDEEDAFVEVNLQELPDDPTELCTLLDNENCSRDFWILISLAYSRDGNTDLAIELLNRGLNSRAIDSGNDQQKMAFWGALSWLYLQKSRESIRKPQGPSSDPNVKYKEGYLDMATNMLNQCSRIDPRWIPNLLARGTYTLIKANLTNSPSERTFLYDNAYRIYDDVLKASKGKNMFAVLGKARVCLRRKKYKQALELYQEVLAKRPDMEPDPRIGIGLCLWHLDHRDHAKLAWERALAINPESKVVNILLGIYHLQKANQYPQGSQEFTECYTKAITQYTQKAFKLDKDFPLACTTFGSYFFARRNLKNVETLARKALEHSDSPEVISDAHYLLARKAHLSKDYSRATQHYSKSDAARTEKGPNSVEPSTSGYLPARVGLGQLQIINSDLSSAKLTFERIIQQNSKCAEALMLLGAIYANEVFAASSQSGVVDVNPDVVASQKKAIQYLEAARAMWKDESKHLVPDVSLLLNLARLYESDSPEKALQCMKEVEKLQREALKATGASEDQIDPRILNNIAVFQYQLGQYEEARALYQQALSALPALAERDSTLDTDALATTLTYNLGRLEEAAGRVEDATKIYEGLLQRHSGYVDAKSRFLYLEITKENPDRDDIAKLANELMQNNRANPEVRALVGWYLGRNRRKFPNTLTAIGEDNEHRHHKHSLQNYDKHDRYALTAMGNLYLVVAREMKRETESDREKRSRMYEKAIEFFDKALQLDGKNAYAAQGIAIALIEDKRKHSPALQILTKLKETIKSEHIYVNLGHCLSQLEQWSRAIENYELAINLQGGKDHNTINCLARVYFMKGRKEKNSEAQKVSSIESLKQALALSKKALELCPQQVVYQFNVAFVQFQLVQVMLLLAPNQRSLEDMEAAAAGLEEAIKTFTNIARGKHSPYPPKDIEQRATMGRNTLTKQLERAIVTQKEYEEQNSAKLAEARRRREEEQRKKQEEEEARRKIEEEKRQKLLETRQHMNEESRRYVEQRVQEEKRALEESEEEQQDRKKRKPREKGGSRKKRRGSYESGDEGEPKGSGSEDEGRRAKKPRKKLTRAKQYKSADFIEDSDEEMEEIAATQPQAKRDSDVEDNDEMEDLFADDDDVADGKSAKGKDSNGAEPDTMDTSE